MSDINNAGLAPDAAARDAALRGTIVFIDDTLMGDDITFITRKTTSDERAAVIAVLAEVRSEESHRARRVERCDRDPWARSQRTPEGIGEVLGG